MVTNTKEVVKALQMLSGQSDNSYRPDNSFSANPQMPQMVQDTIKGTREKESGYALLANIIYKSISGNEKDRDFLIRRVIHSKNDMFIDGMAMDIRAPRLVKVSEIKQIRDVGTGRIYDNAYKFLQERMGLHVKNEILPEKLNTFGELIKRMHNEITVLMYVVALDGIREKSERMAVMKYVKEHTQDLQYTDEELNDYLISVAPDAESAGMAFQRILRKDRQNIQDFISALISVIMSNGKADDKERVFLAKVMDLLETKGFVFNLGF